MQCPDYGTEVAIALSHHAPAWYAVVTRPRHEKTVSAGLRAKGLSEFLPLYKDRRRWSDRVQTVESTLFPGYVFCHFAFPQVLSVRQTAGVMNVVSFAGRPAPLDESEIAAIRTALLSGYPVAPQPYMRAGDFVRIGYGPLAGVEGYLLRENGGLRVVISVSLLQRSISVDVERDCIVNAGVPPVRPLAYS